MNIYYHNHVPMSGGMYGSAEQMVVFKFDMRVYHI